MAISCCNCIRHSLSSSHSWLQLYPYLLATSCSYSIALFHALFHVVFRHNTFISKQLSCGHSLILKCIKAPHVPPFFQQGSNSYKPLLQTQSISRSNNGRRWKWIHWWDHSSAIVSFWHRWFHGVGYRWWSGSFFANGTLALAKKMH